ncbi:MAG: hypothetical protein WC282_02410 [Bacilli bacterium]|jgi:hypothetical protein
MLRKLGFLLGILGFFTAIIIFGVRSFTGNEYPYPSDAFYLNDFAQVFSGSTSNYLVGEAEALFEKTKEIEHVGGAQIVIATYLLDSRDQLAEYNKTTMFREWKIGQNDMGLLAIFYFVEINEETSDNYELIEFQIEATDKMLIYYPVQLQNNIYNQTLGKYLEVDEKTSPYDYDLEMGTACMMNGLVNVAYQDIYNMPAQVYPQAEFEVDYDEYWWNDNSANRYQTNKSLDMFKYFFSPYGTIGDRIVFGTLSALMVVATGGAGIFKAKGGFSSGGGLFKHR